MSTLRDEPNPEGRGWDYDIDDEALRIYRQDILGLGRQKVLVLSGSGNIDVTLRIFSSPRVEPWIITSREGERNLGSQLKRVGLEDTIKIVSVGGSNAGRPCRSRTCRLCCRAKRFKLPFGFARQNKVALSQTLNLVRPNLNLSLPPGHIEIGMMALGLRDGPSLIRKRQGLREVLERVEPRSKCPRPLSLHP